MRPGRRLDETIKPLQGEPVIVIADHPLFNSPGDRKRNHSGIGLTNLKRHRDLFDAAEWNGNFFKSNTNLDAICNTLGLSVVANTDAYGHPIYPFANIGRSYTEFDKKRLDFSNIDLLLTSMRGRIRDGKFETRRQHNGLVSIAYHILMAKWYQSLANNGVDVTIK